MWRRLCGDTGTDALAPVVFGMTFRMRIITILALCAAVAALLVGIVGLRSNHRQLGVCVDRTWNPPTNTYVVTSIDQAAVATDGTIHCGTGSFERATPTGPHNCYGYSTDAYCPGK
jgi:hypothetical protein